MIITIDGPSVSGKSTVALRVAREMDLFYINSGLFFRGLAYLLHTHFDYTNATIADATQKDIDTCLKSNSFVYTYENTNETGPRIFFDGQDITLHLKTELIDKLASLIGTNVYARTQLAQLQRTIACTELEEKKEKGVIVDGRDSGSVVFVDAQFKFYLTASPEVRARRMCKAYTGGDLRTCEQQALHAIKERDVRDAQRKQAPLKIPAGAIVIDTSDMTIDEVVAEICSKAAEAFF